MMRALVILLLLGGCTHVRPSQLCVPLTTWSPADQDALADELDHQDGPRARAAVHDWIVLRAGVRAACPPTP